MASVNIELMSSLAGSRFMESACSADTISMYSIDKCYWAGQTPTCQVVIAKSPIYGKVLFLDQEIQSAESDEAIYHEHLVHPVLAATDHIPNKNVLIVGGGEGATAREVLKWSSVSHVDWIDIDGPLVDLCRRHLCWADDSVYNDSRLVYKAQDIRIFLAASTMKYDVIILDLPDPDVDVLRGSTMEHGPVDYPLYGRYFWQVIREHLTENGAITTHVGPIMPGGDPDERRPGLQWVQEVSSEAGLGQGHSYHVTIPSFQGDWGFWMSIPPSTHPIFPTCLIVMDSDTQKYAFTWPHYWYSSRIGLI